MAKSKLTDVVPQVKVRFADESWSIRWGEETVRAYLNPVNCYVFRGAFTWYLLLDLCCRSTWCPTCGVSGVWRRARIDFYTKGDFFFSGFEN